MRRRRHLDENPIATIPRRLAVAALALGFGACRADAPPELEAGVRAADSIVTEWVARGRVPGAVLLVAKDGRIMYEMGYGLADRQGGEAMTTRTVFDLASVTKVMATTWAIMLLHDRGQLDLDAPVSTWLTDFTGDGRDSITVRHLLTHRSGLPQWVPTYYHAENADEAYDYIRTLPLMWGVGEGRHYSDLGFMLLGRIVERASGRPLDAFLQDELYGPLGLRQTGFRPAALVAGAGGGPDESEVAYAHTSHGNPFERRMVHDPDFGYTIDGDPDAWDGWRDHWLDGQVNDGNAWYAFQGVAGHAGLFSTARELGVLLQLLVDGGIRDGRRYVDEGTIDRFMAPQVEGQALGWQLPDYAPEGAFGHTGFTGTFVLGVPSEGLVLVLLTNRQNFGVDSQTQYPDVGPLQRAVTAAVTGLD